MIVAHRWTGREAAALRQARRMSIRAYAAHLGVAVATVSNWDSRGEHARLRTETQQLLDIDHARAPDDVRQRFAVILASEVDDVKRRRLLGAVAVAAMGTVASATIPTTDGLSRISPRLADTIAGLGHAVLSPIPHATARPVTASALAAAAEQAWHLRQRAQYEALGVLLSGLIPQAEASMTDLSDEQRTRAGHALVHVYNAASSLLKRLDDDSLAAITADRAVRAAQSLDNPALTAAAKYRMANVLLAAGRLDEVQTVALQAADLVDPGTARTPRALAIWGGLLLTAAVAAARKADRSAAWQLLGEARTASHLLGKDHADMYAIFGPTNVAIHSVQVAVELDDGHDALRRGQLVNPDHLPAGLAERRGQFLIDTAHAHALTHDTSAAITSLVDAERVAPQEIQLSGDAHYLVRRLLSHPYTGNTQELRALAGRIGLDN